MKNVKFLTKGEFEKLEQNFREFEKYMRRRKKENPQQINLLEEKEKRFL